MSKAKVIIAAGGTGGHMFPAQALARDLEKKGIEVLFIGAKLSTNKYFHKHLFSHREITSSSFSFRTATGLIKPFINLCRGVMESLRELKRFHPDLIVGFGSFHSAPVLFAAFLKRCPFFLFESNAWPGKVNRLFSPLARLNAVQFSQTLKNLKGKCCIANVPQWHSLATEIPSKEMALSEYGLSQDTPTVLVFGGSQGARSINNAALDLMKVVSDCGKKLQIIHLVGDLSSVAEFQAAYSAMGVIFCVKAFEDQMAKAWAAADFAICRAGAATIAELIRFQKPAILIPYPKAAENHQYLNAQMLHTMGIAVCIKESELNFHVLYKAFERILEKRSYSEMKQNLEGALSRANENNLADLVEDFLKKKQGIQQNV